jgi:acyl-CoA thioesterase II
VSGPKFDLESIIAETIEFITVRKDGGYWVGDAPAWFGERLFGGFVLAQSVHAAATAAAEDRRIHSLHGYFLRPVMAGQPLSHRIIPIRDGRSFAVRHLEAVQSGKPVLWMTCSFATDTDGYEYELPMDPDVPAPDELPTSVGPGPWEVAEVGPTSPAPDGTRVSTRRAWFRVAGPLPDDPNLHAALIAFVTDMTGTGGRPLHLEGDVTGMISIDHAAWFHRPLRADEWLYYDVHSLVNAGGRGLLRGTIYGPDRSLAASVAQEMLLRPVAPDPPMRS